MGSYPNQSAWQLRLDIELILTLEQVQAGKRFLGEQLCL